MQIAFSKTRIQSFLLRSILVLTAFSVSGQIYRFTIGRERFLVDLFNLDQEWNIPTIYSAVTLGLASILLFVIANDARNRLRPFRLHWMILSAGFLAMALDEVIQFHEKLSSPLRRIFHVDGMFHFAWIIPFSFLVMMIFLGYVRFLLHLPITMRLRVISAGIVYLSGALGIEALGGFIFASFGRDTFLYAMISNLEEVLEMAGVYLFISTLLGYLCVNVPRLEVRLTKSTRIEKPGPGRAPTWPRPTLIHRNRFLPKHGPAALQGIKK